jgi:hypothetical protein
MIHTKIRIAEYLSPTTYTKYRRPRYYTKSARRTSKSVNEFNVKKSKQELPNMSILTYSYLLTVPFIIVTRNPRELITDNNATRQYVLYNYSKYRHQNFTTCVILRPFTIHRVLYTTDFIILM